MKSRMILPALLAVGLFCLVSTSSAKAGLFGRHATEPGCGCEAAVEPACGCEADAVRHVLCAARWPVGSPASPLCRQDALAASPLVSPLAVQSPLVVLSPLAVQSPLAVANRLATPARVGLLLGFALIALPSALLRARLLRARLWC